MTDSKSVFDTSNKQDRYFLFRRKKKATRFSESNSLTNAGVDREVKIPMQDTVCQQTAPILLRLWAMSLQTLFTE